MNLPEGVQPLAGSHGLGVGWSPGTGQGLVAGEEERSGILGPATCRETGAELALGIRDPHMAGG
jgi:hypothetical protein